MGQRDKRQHRKRKAPYTDARRPDRGPTWAFLSLLPIAALIVTRIVSIRNDSYTDCVRGGGECANETSPRHAMPCHAMPRIHALPSTAMCSTCIVTSV
jgi:hypothetical protein